MKCVANRTICWGDGSAAPGDAFEIEESAGMSLVERGFASPAEDISEEINEAPAATPVAGGLGRGNGSRAAKPQVLEPGEE